MMNKIRYIFLVLFQVVVIASFAQMTAPSDPGGDPEGGGDPPLGGGAPIGSGTIVLMSLAAAYGARKIHYLNNEEIEE